MGHFPLSASLKQGLVPFWEQATLSSQLSVVSDGDRLYEKGDVLNILFTSAGTPIPPRVIKREILHFGYNRAVHTVISDSIRLDEKGKVFKKCASLILSNFKMKRRGPFKDSENQERILDHCWEAIGDQLLEIRAAICESDLSRDRYLLELAHLEREQLISTVWTLTKLLLPFTMGKTSYGLVGASKILFAVLPEVVLPIDNRQWLGVFKTVDIGDVIRRMAFDIQRWEKVTGEKLNEMDDSKTLTTLPSVYNVMAMAARPKIKTTGA